MTERTMPASPGIHSGVRAGFSLSDHLPAASTWRGVGMLRRGEERRTTKKEESL